MNKKRQHPFNVHIGDSLVGISAQSAMTLVMAYQQEALAELVTAAVKQGLQDGILEMDKSFSLAIKK